MVSFVHNIMPWQLFNQSATADKMLHSNLMKKTWMLTYPIQSECECVKMCPIDNRWRDVFQYDVLIVK